MKKVSLRSHLTIILVILISVYIWSSHAFAATRVDFTLDLTDIGIGASSSIKNVYVRNGVIQISSTNPYTLKIEVEPGRGWTGRVMMNTENSLVRSSNDYAALFDVAVTDGSGQWQGFSNRSITLQQRPTGTDAQGNPEYRRHYLCIALVLVDQKDVALFDNGNQCYVYRDTSGVLLGEEYTRRVNELSGAQYNAKVYLTIIEQL